MRIVIMLLCCFLLSGCQSDTLLPAMSQDDVQAEETLADNQPEKAIVDFDGDRLEDTVELSITDKEHAKAAVTLGCGETLEKEFPGWWWFVDYETGCDSLEPTCVPICDFDDDGKYEILIQLAFAGSSGPSREIHILKIENNQLVELPLDYEFPNISYYPDEIEFISQFKNINDHCFGAQIIRGDDNEPLLRVRHDDSATSNYDGSWYIDCVFSGQGWTVQRLTWSRIFTYGNANE